MTRICDRIYRQAIADKGADVFCGDGTDWVSVRLRDVTPPGMDKSTFGGHLSLLEREGLYRKDTAVTFGLFRIVGEAS